MRERSQTEPLDARFADDESPTIPGARLLDLSPPTTRARSGASEPEPEGESEAELSGEDDFDDFGGKAVVRVTRTGALATAAWDRTLPRGARDALGADEDRLADTERCPMIFDSESPAEPELVPFDRPAHRS